MNATPAAAADAQSRIVLVLRDGTTIPLTAGFTPDVGGQTLALVEQIRTVTQRRTMSS
jgi:hypothetical protein